MTNDCKTCPVSTGTHQPAEALHQIAEPDAQHLQELAAYRFTVENLQARVAELEAIVERREAIIRLLDRDSNENHQHAQTLAFELECMLIDPHEHWDSAARALDAYKQAQGPSPSPFATDVPVPPERKAIYAALRAKREAGQAKQGPTHDPAV